MSAVPHAEFPLGPFRPHEKNPILAPQGEGWESSSVYNPAALVKDGKIVLLYRAHADDIVSHVGLATSNDGFSFERHPEPVLSPSEPYDEFGAEDPRVTEIDGTYYLTYTGWDRKTAQLCLATSTDLFTWTKHGPIFPDFNTFLPQGNGQDGPWSKAGAILPEPIDGRYLMFFGEGSIYHAWSDDLIRWKPCSNDEPLMVPTGPGTFGEFLVEVGPQPIITNNGLILLLHNAAVKYPDGSVRYSCGQLLVDPADPSTVLAQMTRPWLEPSTYEDTHGLVSKTRGSPTTDRVTRPSVSRPTGSGSGTPHWVPDGGERPTHLAGPQTLAGGRGGPAARVQPGVAAPGRGVRVARRRGSARAGAAGGTVDHLPDDPRVLPRSPAGQTRLRSAGRPRTARARGTVPRSGARRLVRRRPP